VTKLIFHRGYGKKYKEGLDIGRIVLLIAIIATISCALQCSYAQVPEEGWGSGGQNSNEDDVWDSESQSHNSDSNGFEIEDEGYASYELAPQPGSERNALWIISDWGDEPILELGLSYGEYARLRMIPGMNGRVVIFESYPNGRTYRFPTNRWLESGRAYRIGFIGDAVGRHTMWYTVNGEESNEVEFNVRNSNNNRGNGNNDNDHRNGRNSNHGNNNPKGAPEERY
jgi:hypothetical protein